MYPTDNVQVSETISGVQTNKVRMQGDECLTETKH